MLSHRASILRAGRRPDRPLAESLCAQLFDCDEEDAPAKKPTGKGAKAGKSNKGKPGRDELR